MTQREHGQDGVERPPHGGEGTPRAPVDDTGSGRGLSEGVPARGEHEGASFSPTGGPGVMHWQEATITEPGLDGRGSVFFAAIEMTRMPMILSDPNQPDNPIVFANRAFQDLTGYTEDELLGRNCRFLQGARTDREAVRQMREAVRERRALSLEVLNYKRDGTPFWNAVFLGPVFDRDGRLLYFFASQLDVTRRRDSEQSFRQAQKMESIGQLTAGLAHDFNNLLQVMLGNLDLAMAMPLADRQRRALDAVARAAEHGSRLTRQLLAFARRTRLEPRPVDLNAVFTEARELFVSTLGQGLGLELELEPDLPACLVDAAHLQMALLNVLINARDATPAGGTVTVSTRRVARDDMAEPHQPSAGDCVAVEVRDTGTGMPPAVLERATEPFFTTKDVGRGTGLGLAMVHGFVQQSGGRLDILSAPGHGTTVRMLFPVMPTPPVPEDPAGQDADADTEAVSPPTGVPPSTETILVAEGSDDLRALASDQLARLGYRVLTANDAASAQRVFDEADGRVDLFLADLTMPGDVDALALAERLRARQPALAVLLTTGYRDDMRADGPRAPGMDVLGKPYRRAELSDRVRMALNHRQADGPKARQAPRQPHPSAEG